MRKIIATVLAGTALIALSGTAAARTNIDVGISFGYPVPVYAVPRPPVAYYPVPVYAPPPVYVAPAPVYYGPPPYYGPRYYAPAVVYDRGWRRGRHHRHHRDHDDDR